MMKIIKKFADKSNNIFGVRQPCVAFFGDSVTQGCFEIYQTSEKSLETEFDQTGPYHAYLAHLLRGIFPRVAATYVNAGISGDNATNALARLERDVLSYKPDLVVVGFGLNDCASGEKGLEVFARSIEKILSAVKAAGAEAVLLTPNDVAAYLSPRVVNQKMPLVQGCIEGTIALGKSGVLDKYVDAARAVAAKLSVPVCDVYARWKILESAGTDVTELLSNSVNHPVRVMNEMVAAMLLDLMLTAE